VGLVRLGQTLGELRKVLGPPTRVTASPNDPNSKLLDYPKRGISVFLGSSGAVIGVVISGRSWRTPEGVAVGTPQGRVTKSFGKGLVRGEGNLTYPARGLAFSFRNGKVHTIYVFQREGDRALMGDRLIEPGRRVGQILLGDPISRLEDAWGRADRVLPLGQGGQERLHSFKEEAIGVVVLAGRIQGVILETGDFITREGVKVGSTRAEVPARLRNHLTGLSPSGSGMTSGASDSGSRGTGSARSRSSRGAADRFPPGWNPRRPVSWKSDPRFRPEDFGQGEFDPVGFWGPSLHGGVWLPHLSAPLRQDTRRSQNRPVRFGSVIIPFQAPTGTRRFRILPSPWATTRDEEAS